MNALFTPLDMTDYENTFVGFNEVGGALPINSYSLLRPMQEEPGPQKDTLDEFVEAEKRPIMSRSRSHRDS